MRLFSQGFPEQTCTETTVMLFRRNRSPGNTSPVFQTRPPDFTPETGTGKI